MCPCPRPYNVPDRNNRGVGLLMSGVTLFAVSYLPAAVIGGSVVDKSKRHTDEPTTLDTDEGARGRREKKLGVRMMIPFVGPFAAMPHSRSAKTKFALGLAGAAQLTAAALTIAGAVRLNRYNQAKRWGLAAAAGPDGAQAAVRVRF